MHNAALELHLSTTMTSLASTDLLVHDIPADAQARANDWSRKAETVVNGLKKREKLPGD